MGLLTAAAALTAVAGGLIALDETRQANTETRRANAETDGREREANANTHVRELYIAAIGLLSADTVDGRLGGIYALERVARDSADDQRTVVEVLSAFVREHTRPPVDDSPPPTQPATDVQAALTVLGRLPTRDGILRADLPAPPSSEPIWSGRTSLAPGWSVTGHFVGSYCCGCAGIRPARRMGTVSLRPVDAAAALFDAPPHQRLAVESTVRERDPSAS